MTNIIDFFTFFNYVFLANSSIYYPYIWLFVLAWRFRCLSQTLVCTIFTIGLSTYFSCAIGGASLDHSIDIEN